MRYSVQWDRDPYNISDSVVWTYVNLETKLLDAFKEMLNLNKILVPANSTNDLANRACH
jgi:hypothetical protein